MTSQTGALCHYTTVEALLKMVSDSGNDLVIEASHIASFDDFSEGNLVRNEVSDRTRHLAVEFDRDHSFTEKVETLLSAHAGKIRLAQIQQEAYVLSLSECIDFLPMWRLYSSNGSGVCLVFDSVKLTHRIAELSGTLRPVDYSGDYVQELRSQMTSMFDGNNLLFFRKNSPHYNPSLAVPEKVLRSLMGNVRVVQNLVNYHSPFIKHSAYKFEQERRAVFLLEERHAHNVTFRGGVRAPIARLKLPLEIPKNQGLLVRVILAPGLEAMSSIAKQRIEALVQTFKGRNPIFKDVEIEQSQIPFYSSYGR